MTRDLLILRMVKRERVDEVDPQVVTERTAVDSAVRCLGGPVYTGRDATRVFLGYADITPTGGETYPGPLLHPARWRQSLTLKLAFAIRGIL